MIKISYLALILGFLGPLMAAVEANQLTIIEGNNKFALELYGRLKNQEGNLFFSPYSISTALAMTYAGAKDETEKQIAQTLCFPDIQKDKFHNVFGKIIKNLNKQSEKGVFELNVANALWGQRGLDFLPEFLNTVKTDYDANLEQVDFKTQAEEVRKTINSWVENKTKDKIKELLKQGMIDSMTRLVLTNAIYFKGKWGSQFKPGQTQDSQFTLLSNDKTNVPMMSQKRDFNYMENDNMQALEMPYENNDLSMVIFLPKKIDGINELEKQLTVENLKNWLSNLHKKEVQVFFPRFKMTSEFSLADILSQMGMKDAFSEKADFSGMTGNRDLFISAVVHKAYVDVNEEGTEAAAATGVTMKVTSVAAPMPVFRADHPFIFLIRDNHTGSILFLGRVSNPSKVN